MEYFRNKKFNLLYQIGFAILFFLATIVWLATFFFILGVPLQGYIIPISIILSLVLVICVEKFSVQQGIILITAVICIVFAKYGIFVFFDL